jgi:hypothetical protein
LRIRQGGRPRNAICSSAQWPALAGILLASAAVAAPATAETGVSNGKTYTVTVIEVEGSTADNLGNWHTRAGQLAGGDQAVVDAFNNASKTSVRQQLDYFRDGWQGTRWNFESSSHVTVRDTTVAQVTNGTIYCCAHPTTDTNTIVIDSRTAKPITLTDLFANEQDGLNRLSEQTKILVPKALESSGPMADMPGNAPRAENFADWIPTAEGMQIYFAEYQFGDRLPAIITVPWSALTDVLAPNMSVLAHG